MFGKNAPYSTAVHECIYASFLSLTIPKISRCYCFIVQACNAHGIYCVPLYDTLGKFFLFPWSNGNTWHSGLSCLQSNCQTKTCCLVHLLTMACCHLPSTSMAVGAGAVEFVLCHAEVQIAFVEEKKIGEVCFVTVTFVWFSHHSQHSKNYCILQVAITEIRHDFVSHHTYIYTFFKDLFCDWKCYPSNLQSLFCISLVATKVHEKCHSFIY